MSLLRPRSIERKLRIMMVATASVVLAVVLVIFLSLQSDSYRTEVRQSLRLQATVLGYLSEFPLDTDNVNEGRDALKILQTTPDIAAGCLFRTNGTLFSKYARADVTNRLPDHPPLPANIGTLEIVAGITNPESRWVGTIYLRADRSRERRFFQKCANGVLASSVGAFLVAWVLSAWFQRIVTVPVRRLLSTIRTVSDRKDYQIRANLSTNDEIGELVVGFNEMLGQIQTRDENLKQYQEHLEDQVTARTTELRLANNDLARAKQLAEEASQSKSRFLANMSHELRTPLNAIIGYSEMLQEEARDLGREDFVPDLEKIQGAGKHLLGLINDILDLSKIEAGKVTLFIEDVDPGQLARDVASTVAPLVAKNGNQLVVQCPAGIGLMRADSTKLRQVLFNLLSNAAKFTDRGVITLHVSHETSGDSHAENPDSWIQFRVTDTGIGMTAEQMRRLFRAFEQADAGTTRKFGGTGLGLAITQRFCELMGGRVTVQSELGQGTEFTVVVPRDMSPSTPPKEDPATRPDVVLGTGPLVLVIDDDASCRELMRRNLVRAGYRAAIAANGAEGLELARQSRPAAITLDVMMPGMDGWSVLTAFKADPELADIPIVMVSIADDRNQGVALGAAEYLVKPIDWPRLLGLLARFRPSTSPWRVLVVEDDVALRELLRRQLEGAGWSVAIASNGVEALRFFAEMPPAVILLDLLMPVMDGFEFIGELRARPDGQTVPIIVITGRDLSDDDRRRLNGHVTRILQKGGPGFDQFLAELRALLTHDTQLPLPPCL